MKIVNSSEEFEIKFNGTPYTIPKGEFEVINERLGNHILFLANKWNMNVKTVPNSNINQIKKIEKVEKEEVIKPVFSGATTQTLPNNTAPLPKSEVVVESFNPSPKKSPGRPRKNALPQVA